MPTVSTLPTRSKPISPEPISEKRPFEDYNAAVGSWQNENAATLARAEFDDETLLALEIDDTASLRTDRHAACLKIAQDAVRLCQRRGELLNDLYPILAKYRQAADENLAKAVKAAESSLKKIGITLESQRAYAVNPGAARISFDHRIREMPVWRKANESQAEAVNNLAGCGGDISRVKDQAAGAVAYLRFLANKMAGIE